MSERSIGATRLPAEARVDDRFRRALNRWQSLVIALDSVDDVTTEVVRLRAAQHHDCHT
jgi:hypothetical protein